MGLLHWSLTVLVSLILLGSILSSGLMFHEHLHVRSLPGNGDYPFGSEEAIATGGHAYTSKAAYLRSTLFDGLTFGAISAAIAIGVFGRRKWFAALGSIIWVAYVSLQATGLL